MSFFKKFKNFSQKREELIKETIIQNLNENVKEIQFEFKENNKDYLEVTDSTNSLCATLETIFLHGLKDSFLWQTIKAISGDDADHRPEPNFWPLLLVFLHSNTIEQIESLSQVTSEIGYCRAWIRLSLNESLLSSYFNNIRKDSSALNPYYKNHAFLKDQDQLDLAAKIIEGIETCVEINLPINSSLLNHWTNLPLQMAGIWTPSLKQCPISSGVDIASSLSSEIQIPKPLRSSDCFTESISSSPFQNFGLFKEFKTEMELSSEAAASDLSDTENLHIFLSKIEQIDERNEDLVEECNETTEEKYSDLIEECKKMTAEDQNLDKPINNDITIDSIKTENNLKNDIAKSSLPGNSLNVEGWSDEPKIEKTEAFDSEADSKNLKLKIPEKTVSRSNSLTTSVSSLRSPIDFNTLLIKHEKNRSQQQLDLENDLRDRFELSLGLKNEPEEENDDGNNDVAEEEASSINNMDFEIVPKIVSEKFTRRELQQMVTYLCSLALEPGLHRQGFVCKGCTYPLGIGFANAKVCAFTGNYFCDQCMSHIQFSIPAKIIFNWDFRRYSVSIRAAAFLTEFEHPPFIDLKLLNPKIYQAIEEMDHMQSLRIRLNFIRAYLYTCCQSSIEEFQKILKSKEYLYRHIHQYSISDLMMIQQGQLSQLLEKAVKFGEEHVLNCNLCSLKGFICEICSGPKVVYPFHLDTTYRCQDCGAVFHDFCSEKFLNQSEPCPKCERKRKREDLPLLEAIQHL